MLVQENYYKSNKEREKLLEDSRMKKQALLKQLDNGRARHYDRRKSSSHEGFRAVGHKY